MKRLSIVRIKLLLRMGYEAKVTVRVFVDVRWNSRSWMKVLEELERFRGFLYVESSA